MVLKTIFPGYGIWASLVLFFKLLYYILLTDINLWSSTKDISSITLSGPVVPPSCFRQLVLLMLPTTSDDPEQDCGQEGDRDEEKTVTED